MILLWNLAIEARKYRLHFIGCLNPFFFRNSKEDTSNSADSSFFEIDWDSLFEGVEETNNINILKNPKKKHKKK